MENNAKQALIDYLASYVTEHKKSQMEQVLSLRTRHITIVLEDVFQEHNTSAVARSCDIFGVQDLHVVEQKYKSKLINGISRGSEKWIDIHSYSSIADCIAALKKDGYTIIATVPQDKAISLYDLPLNKKIALLFGTENTGLSEQALALADGFTIIPMYGFTQSFNVSVCAALCLQHIIRSLHQSSIDWHLTPGEMNDLRLKWYKSSIRTGELLEQKFLLGHK
jgi:tRNA (guanosine-2'-O-)-methyltransferase